MADHVLAVLHTFLSFMKLSHNNLKNLKMRKIFTLLFMVVLLSGNMIAQGTRYVDEVFTNVTRLNNNLYSINVTVFTGGPTIDTLLFDLYMPAGDTCTLRPLAVVLHTGTFLPRGLFAAVGDKDDYANVQIATRLAMRGYVAASVQYRVGWNPVSPQDTVRRSTIINAAYRGIQDLHAFIRYMNLTVVELGNPYKIDTSRVAVFGIGTGAFVGFNAAVLEQHEIYIDKFTNPSGSPMIDTFLVGNLTGETPGLINIPNHVGYNDNFHFVFGLDGAVGDSSWMEDGNSVPLVAGGNVTHPTTPFGISQITGEIDCDMPVFAAGQYVVDISGSLCLIEKANSIGINSPLNKGTYDDPVSQALRENDRTFGQEHLWAINQPGPQTGPWEYWDSTFWKTINHPFGGSIHSQSIVTNPDMSIEKANRYIDTALWFFSPRAHVALKLNELVCSCEGIIPDPSIFLIDDFECQRNFTFGAGVDRLMVMDNPDSDPGNTSEKVGAYLEPANDPWAALCLNAVDSIDLSVFKVFKIDVNSPAAGVPFLIKLEGGSSPAFEVWTNPVSTGTWETLEADFSSQEDEHHTRICIFPNGGADSPNEVTYLFDNIRFEIKTSLFNPTVETLQISPNPVQDVVYIRNPGEAVFFRVVNSIGQQVMDLKTNGQTIVPLIVSQLHHGIYLIGAYDSSGELIGNARILKN